MGDQCSMVVLARVLLVDDERLYLFPNLCGPLHNFRESYLVLTKISHDFLIDKMLSHMLS